MKFKGKWNPETQEYRNTCLRLSKDLKGFKQDAYYIGFVGNDNRPPATVEAFDKVVNLPYVSKNDNIGNPKIHNGKSAGTLRFMKVFQDTNNTYNESIIEIGGGYGGQCLVYKELCNVDYTILDLPEALELSKAYLKANDVDCTFISSEDIPPLECDLLISDYCLSELSDDGIDCYLNAVRFKRGYFTLNAKFDYIIDKLKAMGYLVDVKDEIPATSRHKNKIIYAELI